MVFTQGRVWLGGVALASTLLACTVPGVPVSAHAQASPAGPKLVAASPFLPAGTGVHVVQQQLRLVSVPTPITSVAMVARPQQDNVKPVDPPVSKSKAPVQVAQAASAQPAKAAVAKPVQEVSRGTDGNTLVNHALSLLGVPYVFGGTTRNGFDCSGFTRYVYAGTGISLPRTSYDQFGVGSAVSRAQLEPGDLVFFTTYSAGASHVGIYIGGGQFVHASNHGVRVTSLNDSYYVSRFLGGRRVGR